MPAFSRFLVLSALAVAASVQSAPVGIVESRELGHVRHRVPPCLPSEFVLILVPYVTGEPLRRARLRTARGAALPLPQPRQWGQGWREVAPLRS